MDLKTIIFCLFIINLFMGLYTVVVKKIQPSFSGINYWIVSNFLIAIGYLFITLRGHIPDFFSIVVALTIFNVAGHLRIFGINQFLEQKHQKWFLYLTYMGIPSTAFLFLYFTYVIDNMVIRTSLCGLYLSVISVITGLLLHRKAPINGSFSYKFAAYTFYLFAVIFITRIIIWIFVPSARGVFTANFFNYAQFLSSMLIDIAWTTLFILIYNQKLNQKIAESEEKFRNIFELNSSAMALIGFDTNINMVNDEYCDISGYTKEELVGKSWTKIIPPEDLPRMLEYNRNRIIDPESAPNKYEFSLVHKGGEIIHALMSVKVLPRLKLIIASFTDITERKRDEEQLLKFARDLQNLIENKDLFLSVIAHDLRTPFSVLINLSDLLHENIENMDIKTIRSDLKTLYNISKDTWYLFEDLLTYAKSQEGIIPFEPVESNFFSACCEIVGYIKEFAKRKNIEMQVADKQNKIYADVNMFNIILRNLLTNAIKYSNNNGKIYLDIDEDNNNSIVSITDNGEGIRREIIEKLWKSGWKSNSEKTIKEKGSGLGLLLCQEFVGKHGGKIWVESEVGIGTTFKFSLPLQNK